MLNKRFRAAQKGIDREVAHVHNSGADVEQCLQKPVSLGEVTKAIDNMVEKLSILKRKVNKLLNDTGISITQMFW